LALTTRRAQPLTEALFKRALTVVVVAETSSITAAVIDSLPDEISYFLVGPQSIAFLRHAIRCREYFVNDLSLEERNQTEFVRTIQRLGVEKSNLFLIPVDDSANRIVQLTIGRLGAMSYPMPDSRTFEVLNDKWQFHQKCSEIGVRVPKAICLKDKSEIDCEYVRKKVGLPFVLKPTNKSNGLGVKIIGSEKSLSEQILSVRKYDYSPLMAQSFIAGIDIDISALVDRGYIKQFAIQTRKRDALHFVKNDELLEATKIIVRELCYTGVIHIDARLGTSGKIFLIEANPRFWGSLAEATSGGLNFVRAGIYTSVGLESPDPATICNVSVPSTKQMLKDILTFKRSYWRLGQLERLRLRRAARIYMRSALHLP